MAKKRKSHDKDGRATNRCGQRGSHLLRAAFRDLEIPDREQRNPEGQLEAASGSAGPFERPGVDLQALCQPLLCTGTFLQNHLMLSACKRLVNSPVPDPDDVDEKLCDRFLFTPARPQTSLTAEADSLHVERSALRGDLTSTAAAVWQLGCQAWSSHLHMLKGMVHAGQVEIAGVFKCRVYDETPLKLRVPTNASQQRQTVGSKADTCIAKVMQTRFKIGVLVKQVATGSRLFYKGVVPTVLQGLERTRGEDICLSQRRIIDSVAVLDQLASLSKISVDVSTSDRYVANAKAEVGLQILRPADTPLHADCEVHKASTCVTWALNGVEHHVSGLIACSIVLRQAGSLASFRQHLLEEIESDFLIVHGEPPKGHAEVFRAEVYATFLEGQVAREQDAKRLQQRRASQKAILDRFLCGDLEGQTVQFFLRIVDATEADAWTVLRETVLPALLPVGMPTYARHRWMGGEQSVDWIGLIECHHHLFSRTVLRMFRVQAPLTEATAPVPVQGDSWDALVAAVVGHGPNPPAQPQPDTLLDAILADLAAVAAEDEKAAAKSEQDWVEFNKSMRKKLVAWVGTSDLSIMALVRHALSISSKLLFALLARTGDRFDMAQQKLLHKGEPRGNRMTAAVMCEDVDTAMQSIGTCFHSVPAAIPLKSRTREHRVVMFQLLARMCGAIEFLIRSLRQVCPYKTAMLLLDPVPGTAQDVLNTPPCMMDSFTRKLISTYPTPEELVSAEALSILHSVFDLCELDVAGIECRHASIRHLLDSKNATWDVILETLSADFLVRQATIQNSMYQDLVSDTPLHAGIAKNPSQPLRKISRRKRRAREPSKKVHGGGQRAYFHHRMQQFSKTEKKQIGLSNLYKQMHGEYKSLAVEDMEHFSRLGRAAKVTGRAGFRPFRQKPKRQQSVGQLQIAGSLPFELSLDVRKQAQGVLSRTRQVTKEATQTQIAAKVEEEAVVLQQRRNIRLNSSVVADLGVPCAMFVPTLDDGPGPLRSADWCNPCNDLAKDSVGVCVCWGQIN